jgi:hypothetical protein
MDQQPNGMRVALVDLGEDAPATDTVAVYDWRTGCVEVLPRDGAYDVALDPAGWDYRVLAPVVDGWIAVIGDPALYASAGDSRVAEVAREADGSVIVSLLGANERVRLLGWSARMIAARAWSPTTGTLSIDVTHDAATGKWELAVEVPPPGWTRVRLEPSR